MSLGAASLRRLDIGALWRETWRYVVVSAISLAVDFACLVGLTEFAHIYYLISAAVGFIVGGIVNYALSVKFVFRKRRLANRWIEFAGFIGVGVVGLAVNEGLMKVFVDTVGLGYAIAKAPAAAGDFAFNFGLRKILLFTDPKHAEAKA